MTEPTQFLTNKDGEKIAVVISIEEYEKLREQLEELDEIRAFDEAEASGEAAVPFERTVSELHPPK
ncbi:MAG: type II toxin-antitoxin system prevent-host-death family antitoxin [Candidatus Acidiferrum sp.]|jgi:PHD/YefM family antitoxin component YafN of YafNO toxin-antitoxin module